METTKNSITLGTPNAFIPSEPSPPSAFETGVAEQLKALAEQLESGCLHIVHFALTVTGDKQRLEIEVE